MLELKGVSAGYGAVPALRNISLTVATGEVVALVGPNGAGKTTVLRTISSLLKPTTGDIRFNGKSLTGGTPADVVKAGIAHCPEERKVWPHMTVEENLELGAYVLPKQDQLKRKLEEVYADFPVLKERRGEMAGRLSGGQQQMLAIGRALMSEPKLIMFDEPSLGLSPILMQQVGAIIRTVHGKGVSVLLVEQNVEMALMLADRAYVVGVGQIVAEDKASSLLSNPSLLKAYLGG
ncbi:ABC transporter ATP-binding protein [Microbacteriaceae bacterium K1510]|nr:ABC transporter ATP-binding protein [Microbacteriaceae bacterium K1510]